MKKLLAFFLALLTLASISMFCSCKAKSVEPLVIAVSEINVDGMTLKDYMEQKNIDYSMSDGMVNEINGVKNSTNQFWMLYTNDTENSNTAWGTYVYNGEVFGSATYGAETLPVKANCTYIWVYQKF